MPPCGRIRTRLKNPVALVLGLTPSKCRMVEVRGFEPLILNCVFLVFACVHFQRLTQSQIVLDTGKQGGKYGERDSPKKAPVKVLERSLL